MNKFIVAVATAASLMASQANALGVDINGITGTWLSATGAPSTTTGVGTSELRWGDEAPGDKSGYDYVAAETPIENIAPNAVFGLGTFRHLNKPIFPPSITGAVLQLVIDLDIGGTLETITQTYEFSHDETPNNANPCAYAGANGQGVNIFGCADRVKATINLAASDSFMDSMGNEYVFTINGFEVEGSTFTEFLTVEGKTNEAVLKGSYTLKQNIGVVPVPAAGLLLLTVVAGIGVLSRRKAA